MRMSLPIFDNSCLPPGWCDLMKFIYLPNSSVHTKPVTTCLQLNTYPHPHDVDHITHLLVVAINKSEYVCEQWINPGGANNGSNQG